jgi:Tfp pilus assembly protein PilZ
MKEKKEWRRHPRFSVQIVAQITYDKQILSVSTKDMSRGGICLISSQGIPLGSVIVISMVLMLGKKSFSECFELCGKVVWCTRLDERYQIGVAFADIDDSTRSFLEMFLKFLNQEIRWSTEAELSTTQNPFDLENEDE